MGKWDRRRQFSMVATDTFAIRSREELLSAITRIFEGSSGRGCEAGRLVTNVPTTTWRAGGPWRSGNGSRCHGCRASVGYPVIVGKRPCRRWI